MSSLLGSIFGNEAAAHVAVATDADLFGGAVLPPIVVNRRHAAAATTTTATTLAKKKTNIISSFVNNDSEDDDDDDNDDDELAHEETSSSQDISTAAITTTTVKKTKQEIHEETQNKLRRTIFVGNLPPDITRKALASLFASTLDCGKVESARLRSIPVTGIKLPPQYAGNRKLMRKVCINTGRVGYNSVIATDAPSIGGGGGIVIAKTCAQGYVVFEKLESVQLALNKNNTMYENRTMRVDRVVVVPDDGGSSTTTTTTTTIKHDVAKNSVFVGNLPYGAGDITSTLYECIIRRRQ